MYSSKPTKRCRRSQWAWVTCVHWMEAVDVREKRGREYWKFIPRSANGRCRRSHDEPLQRWETSRLKTSRAKGTNSEQVCNRIESKLIVRIQHMSGHFPNMPYQKQPNGICANRQMYQWRKTRLEKIWTVASGSTRTNNLNDAVNLEVAISKAKGLIQNMPCRLAWTGGQLL